MFAVRFVEEFRLLVHLVSSGEQVVLPARPPAAGAVAKLDSVAGLGTQSC